MFANLFVIVYGRLFRGIARFTRPLPIILKDLYVRKRFLGNYLSYRFIVDLWFTLRIVPSSFLGSFPSLFFFSAFLATDCICWMRDLCRESASSLSKKFIPSKLEKLMNCVRDKYLVHLHYSLLAAFLDTWIQRSLMNYATTFMQINRNKFLPTILWCVFSFVGSHIADFDRSASI